MPGRLSPQHQGARKAALDKARQFDRGGPGTGQEDDGLPAVRSHPGPGHLLRLLPGPPGTGGARHPARPGSAVQPGLAANQNVAAAPFPDKMVAALAAEAVLEKIIGHRRFY